MYFVAGALAIAAGVF